MSCGGEVILHGRNPDKLEQARQEVLKHVAPAQDKAPEAAAAARVHIVLGRKSCCELRSVGGPERGRLFNRIKPVLKRTFLDV